QAYVAPSPTGSSEIVTLASGSILAHGDQSCHFVKSFTWECAISGAAATTSLRSILKSAGCRATTMTNTRMTAARPMRIFLSMLNSFGFGNGSGPLREKVIGHSGRDPVEGVFVGRQGLSG